MKQIQCDHISEIPIIAAKIIALCKDNKVWVFQGEMGAGKTTLIKAICEKLGIVDAVSSPTFSIVNEYTDEEGDAIYHFDFYRLKDPMEAFDMGVEEYFASGSYCFVEWAERIPMFLPDEFALISIESESDEKRIIAIKTINQ